MVGLGTVGVGGALAGAGTSAFFSDEQQLPNRMVAGELRLSVDWQEKYDDGGGFEKIDAFPDTENSGVQDVEFYENNVCTDSFREYEQAPLESSYRTNNDWTTPGDPLINLDDIKPGDCGEVTLSYHLCDNPGWIWFRTKRMEFPENPDEQHLVDAIQATVWYDEHEGKESEQAHRGDNVYQEGKEPVLAQGSLRDVLETLGDGVLLDPDPMIDPSADTSTGDCVETAKFDNEGNSELKIGETYSLTGDDEDVEIEITGLLVKDEGEDEEVVGFEWKSDHGICQIDVVGGPPDEKRTKENVYDCSFEGTAVAPTGAGPNGMKRRGVSNFKFWYCADENEPSEPDCFEPSTTHYLGFEWCLPAETGNEVQGDSLKFDFGFYTEQCRHNDPEDPGWTAYEDD